MLILKSVDTESSLTRFVFAHLLLGHQVRSLGSRSSVPHKCTSILDTRSLHLLLNHNNSSVHPTTEPTLIMLRVMKERSKSVGDSSRESSSVSPNEPLVTRTQDTTPVISNVPHSISVPNSHEPTSSNSSISSEGLHVMAPLTKISQDETHSGRYLAASTQDSVGESIPKEKQPAPKNDDSAAHKRTNDRSFARKVSGSDVAGNESDESAMSKRRKLLHSVPTPSVRLLAMPEDSSALNSLHTFCRMQIEVFSATSVDMAQPAPGRKTPIKLHQVGLRCIHCRHLTPRDRIKRAVCYPRSVDRIYHSVSDMKFDHFPACRGFSPELRAQFQALKEECKKRSDRKEGSFSTAQYYHDAACKMGLFNSRESNGIFMANQVLDLQQLPASVMQNEPVAPSADVPVVCGIPPDQANSLQQQPTFPVGLPTGMNSQFMALYRNIQNFSSSSPTLLPNNELKVQSQSATTTSALTNIHKPTLLSSPPSTKKLCLLAMPEDSAALNDLHCFVRRNVEVFVATKDDAAAPSPGRKIRVKVGQVGLRCIHCAHLPLKERVKRAVCYPPNVSGIYHSISNMKFDHFGSCKGLSPEAQIEFANLRSSRNRRNTLSSNKSQGTSSSTAQYYEESAARLGLVDTDGGIQFRHEVLPSLSSVDEGNATDGISALMIAATDPIIRAEFDRRKALLAEQVGASAMAIASV